MRGGGGRRRNAMARMSGCQSYPFGRWRCGFGYPDAALADSHKALDVAREIGQAATLMSALTNTSLTLIPCGSYAMATAQLDEVVALADEKETPYWRARGMILQGCELVMSGKSLDAVKMISSGLSAYRATGAAVLATFALSSFLPAAYAQLGQFDSAWEHINEMLLLVQETNERWCEPEVYRIAGELVLLSRDRDTPKAEEYFERALAAARKQQAKSWELRAAMSLVRLWRDQGKVQQARELLAPVYGLSITHNSGCV
jgi:predicted ATPase